MLVLPERFASSKIDNNCDDEAVKGEGFCENEDQNHSHNHFSLRVGSHSCITHNANGQASSQ